MKYTIDELREIAENDQGQDCDRPWCYTDRCHYCGGVKGFIDWLASQHAVQADAVCQCKNPDTISVGGIIRCAKCGERTA